MASRACLVALKKVIAAAAVRSDRLMSKNLIKDGESKANVHKSDFPASNVPKTKGTCSAPQRNRVTLAFFGQDCAKTQDICSVHSETVRQLPLFEPRFGPKYKKRST